MKNKDRMKNIVKKGIMFAGAISRSLFGIGAIALIFFSIKKRRK